MPQLLAQAVEAQTDARVTAQHLRIAVRFGFEQKAIHIALGRAKTRVVFRGQRNDIHRPNHFVILRGHHKVGDLLTGGFGLMGAFINVFDQSAHLARRVRSFDGCGFSLL